MPDEIATSDKEQYTPEELIEKWRREVKSYPTATGERAKAAAAAVRLCADELERSLSTDSDEERGL